MGKRLTATLYLMKSQQISMKVDGIDAFRREAPAVLRATQLMTSVHPLLTELQGIRAEVGALGSQLRETEQPDGLEWALEGRLVGRLAFIAEQLEQAAGLEPLPRVRAA